jgi:hypothetical protein
MLIAALVLDQHFEDAERDPILFSFQSFEVEVDDIPFPFPFPSVNAFDWRKHHLLKDP